VVLDVRQAADAHGEFPATAALGYFPASLGDLPVGQFQALPRLT
jgi:hypothetical protein